MNEVDPGYNPHGVPEAGVSETPGALPGSAGCAGSATLEPGKRGIFSRRRNVVVGAAVALVAAAGISIGVLATSASSSSGTTNAGGPAAGAGRAGFGGGSGSNARSTNEPGGTAGTVSGVTDSGFTVTTTIGETMTIDENSSTTYQDATSGSATASTASAVTSGAGVLVLGTVNGTTITAAQVTTEPAGSPYTTASSDVSAVQQGQQNSAPSYGTIPSDYVEGQGTIVDASTADKAVTTALAAYPGGIVDRVVQLPDGDYEVHDIGTNIHHVFEDSNFQVIGAN